MSVDAKRLVTMLDGTGTVRYRLVREEDAYRYNDVAPFEVNRSDDPGLLLDIRDALGRLAELERTERQPRRETIFHPDRNGTIPPPPNPPKPGPGGCYSETFHPARGARIPKPPRPATAKRKPTSEGGAFGGRGMRIRLVFDRWQKRTQTQHGPGLRDVVYPEQLEVEGMVFHAGSTFPADVELDEEDAADLLEALKGGYIPNFYAIEAGGDDDDSGNGEGGAVGGEPGRDRADKAVAQ